MKQMRAIDKFLSKLPSTRDENACWVWLGTDNGKGYGVFFHDHNVFAHRYSYELFVGEIPAGLTIDHLCENTKCVNPRHLEPVTITENVLRQKARIVDCKRGHPLSGVNVYVDKRGYRSCKTCQIKHRAEYRMRHRTSRVSRKEKNPHA